MTSNLADGIARLAIPLAAVALTKDPMAIALLGALMYVPWLLFGVPAGMIVDRIDRRYAMAIANAARLVAAAGVALCIASDNVTIAVLAIATVVFGLGETLFDNATTAITPSLVKKEGLDKANGMIQAAQTGVDMFVATPISGVLYSIAVILPMIVGGAGYAIAALLVLTLPVAAAKSRHESGELVDPVPLKEAVGFVWHHRYLRSLVLFTTAIGTAFALAQAVTALLYLDRFAIKAQWFGVVTAGIGIGAVAGSLLAGASVKKFGRGHTMLWASMIAGVGLVGVGFAPNAWLATVAYGLSAAGVSMWNVPWGSLRQAIIPGHMLGRAIGSIRTFAWSLMPLAVLAGGWIAKVDLQLPYIVGGVVSVVVTIGGARLLLQADKHFPVDAPAEPAADVTEAVVA
ncbi:MAG: MFS transporter [Demequina sp.]|jgi:MFS family permease|nr:MFS transporter [Demequina sp.]